MSSQDMTASHRVTLSQGGRQIFWIVTLGLWVDLVCLAFVIVCQASCLFDSPFKPCAVHYVNKRGAGEFHGWVCSHLCVSIFNKACGPWNVFLRWQGFGPQCAGRLLLKGQLHEKQPLCAQSKVSMIFG